MLGMYSIESSLMCVPVNFCCRDGIGGYADDGSLLMERVVLFWMVIEIGDNGATTHPLRRTTEARE